MLGSEVAMPYQLHLQHNRGLQLSLKIKRIVPLIANGELQVHHLSLLVRLVMPVVSTRALVLDPLNQRASLRAARADPGDHLALRIIVAAKNEQTYNKSYN